MDTGSKSRYYIKLPDILPLSLLWVGMLAVLYLASRHNYLLFHSIVEIAGISVSFALFMMAWNSRRFTVNGFLLFIGIALFYGALLDILHTLAYKGMNVFAGYDANLPTQLWIASQYLRSLSFLAAFFFISRTINIAVVMVCFMGIVGLTAGSIFYWKLFPDCYIEGSGLTNFKIVSEYVISGLYVLSIVLLMKFRRAFDERVQSLLLYSLSASVVSELFFTMYMNVFGFSNMAGHLSKVVAIYLLYRAIIETGLVKPYDLLFRDLKQSEERLLRAAMDAPFPVMIHAENGEIILLNTVWAALTGYNAAEMPTFEVWAVKTCGERRGEMIASSRDLFRQTRKVRSGEYLITARSGRKMTWDFSSAPLGTLPDGRHLVITMAVDITERKIAEHQRERLIDELQAAVAEIKTLTGLLPICSYCKKIRDDQGYWTQIESYIKAHSEAEFSHGICPACLEKEFPEQSRRMKEKKSKTDKSNP